MTNKQSKNRGDITSMKLRTQMWWDVTLNMGYKPVGGGVKKSVITNAQRPAISSYKKQSTGI